MEFCYVFLKNILCICLWVLILSAIGVGRYCLT